ncbi:MAG: dihydrolipoamide acetyltransferase family protein [Steroidobacteraceae bacterium]
MSATIEIRAPSEQTEGTRSQIQRWLKSVGDAVVENEPLIELETDKVTIEIPAPAGGVLAEILKQEQEEVAPGELIGRIQTGAESQATAKVVAPAQEVAQGPVIDDATTAALSAHAVALSGGRNSPAVRRLLSEHKLHAADIRGSGAGGRITVDDVLEHIAKKQQPASPRAREQRAASQSAGQGRRVPHTSIRKRIAERMVASLLNTAPHVTTIFEVDLGAVLAHRAQHRADFEQRGASLTLTAYFLAACVDAIREVPEVNSRWTDDALEIYDNLDMGVGTAVEGKGLVVPVVRTVESLDLFGIARTLSDLVARAREDKLTPADVRGGTFTISNHGVSGSLVATPIVINQPQSAILGVGKLEKRAVVVDDNGTDRIVARPRCYVTLTLDHRVMDGHRANRFLQVLVERLESWRE